MMRRKRRYERKKNRPTDVYRLLNKNLGRNWTACILSGIIFLPSLIIDINIGFTVLGGFITIFMGLIFIQSIRAIVRLRQLKMILLVNPHSVTLKQIIEAPNIKVLFWLP